MPLARTCGVDFHQDAVTVHAVREADSDKGAGVYAARDIAAVHNDLIPLITVPNDCILSLENIWLFAKSDRHLREVLEALGGFSKVRDRPLQEWHWITRCVHIGLAALKRKQRPCWWHLNSESASVLTD